LGPFLFPLFFQPFAVFTSTWLPFEGGPPPTRKLPLIPSNFPSSPLRSIPPSHTIPPLLLLAPLVVQNSYRYEEICSVFSGTHFPPPNESQNFGVFFFFCEPPLMFLFVSLRGSQKTFPFVYPCKGLFLSPVWGSCLICLLFCAFSSVLMFALLDQ